MREKIQMDTGSQERKICYLLDGLPSAFEFFHSKHIRCDESYKQGNEPSYASPDEKISARYEKGCSLLPANEFKRHPMHQDKPKGKDTKSLSQFQAVHASRVGRVDDQIPYIYKDRILRPSF
jgi:hypothetical protein